MTTITNEVGRLTRTEREVRNAAAVAGAILGALLGSPAGLSGGVTGALLFGAFGFAGGIVAEREARRAASKRFDDAARAPEEGAEADLPESHDGSNVSNSSTIEPPCPRCIEARRASANRVRWCASHSEHHAHGRLHYVYPAPFGVGSMFLRPEPS